MKKKFFAMSAAIALLFVGYSCSTDESAPEEKQNQAEVSFAFMEPADIETRAAGTDGILGYQPWKEYTECKTGFDEKTGEPIPLAIKAKDLLAHIKGQKPTDATESYFTTSFDEYLTISEKPDGSWVTQTITVDAGKPYEITSIEIVNQGKNIVYYSGVADGAIFAPYVGATLPQTFEVKDAFTKPTVDLWVLCARGRDAKEFGKPKFDLNRVEVSCIPVFVDVCNKDGEEFVANGTISLKKVENSVEPALSAFTTKTAVVDDLKSGQISYVCFADNLDIPDAQEWYLITINATAPDGTAYQKSGVFSLVQLKDYVNCPLWNETYGFIDVLLCDDCITRAPLNENFDYTSIPNLEAKGWTGFTGDMSIVGGGVPSTGKYMMFFGNDNKGTDSYSITTEKFKYTQGEKIKMHVQAYFKKFTPFNENADVTINVTLKKDGTEYYIGQNKFNVSNCNQGKWLQKELEIPCGTQLATDCYQMQLDIVMPGNASCNNFFWYEVYKFGIDNLKNEN